MNKKVIYILLLSVVCYSFSFTQSLRILTYNTRHSENNEGGVTPEAIASVIKSFHPDIVALQEMDSITTRANYVFQVEKIAQLTNIPYYFFAKAMDYDSGSYGNGILSRFPIDTALSYPLPSISAGEPRVAGEIRIHISDSTMLRFVCTHLDYRKDSSDRIQQIQRLIPFIADTINPIILAGDMNSTPDSKEIGMIKTIFTDATSESGYTYPEDTPSEKIDYVFTDKYHRWEYQDLTALRDNPASDHCPVFIIVTYKGTK